MPTIALFSTGDEFDWTVPGGVTSLALALAGGNAQAITTTLPVTPGEILRFNVGGSPADAPTFGDGGWNGGGQGEPVYVAVSDEYVTTGGYGATDVRQGGTGLDDRILVAGGKGGVTVDASTGGASSGDGGDIDGALGYSILGPQPGPSDPPRAPRVPDPSLPGLAILLTGTSGDVTVGGTAGSYGDHYAGAGGGGWGGGASGGLYTFTDGGDPPAVRGVGANTGGWYAADGITALPGSFMAAYVTPPTPDYTGGFVRLTWTTSRGGWSTGRIGF